MLSNHLPLLSLKGGMHLHSGWERNQPQPHFSVLHTSRSVFPPAVSDPVAPSFSKAYKIQTKADNVMFFFYCLILERQRELALFAH